MGLELWEEVGQDLELELELELELDLGVVVLFQGYTTTLVFEARVLSSQPHLNRTIAHTHPVGRGPKEAS